jgi:predicted TIM-barrel fold metal-dependent hydrolase
MARYTGPIVDVDIHHSWKSPDEIIAYMPKEWREYAKANPRVASAGLYPRAGIVNGNVAHGAMRRDTWLDDGSWPGGDYPLLKEQVLDRYNYWRGVLTYNVGGHAQLLNQEFALAAARAAHDWNFDTWLSWDERLYGVVSPPLGTPEEAAAEVRRVGKHPKIVETCLGGTPLGRPYGDPVYHPVLEASAELGLPIGLHPGAVSAERQPGGRPTSNIGSVPLMAQEAMHHITSFIVHGVFEKYPTLKVIVKEFGVSWLPYLMWRLDDRYDLLKLESPWVKRWPSEYIRDHVLLDTQPLEESPDPKGLHEALSTVDGIDEMLCFATDYPHLSFDDPNYVARKLPSEWSRKVMCDNASAAYGWAPPPADAVFEQPALAAA